ncbi:MAG: hypothetical protein A3I44_02180 [Candidatus Sungbacteria bacterium RIFCSPLOWO2_02_FULL_51_17]|uniref:Transcription regulator TrmB N-terminal domain-containing protein n=1 Tax=Candidatus Sungbacteria bacterium RIFCSPHIGHO2_02_FULL_51_29 TaxID=1802273 RepID=A0A1G2KX38_9BACT|nr:MAG: hypothetical protein A2676_04180 [Candidatus Sungbacteria bacterium RIFCSPHIGHO2_01_FULL_51_22]OHA03132.1 MAG: hypothetical protein A3C16_01645 [Candidatus Sungbacteria bacterium RIFCSPHIGHO2_02_FULL_51_29]OHA04909.1 MAG: hypothetical protein A3B29_01020 [Candidatus Sungbacteria bacterium RIFCSPLOWO2_01_FULL_51_34]OHA11085.1 MAG: hypothetical protein A3I44_02180 [Candidatus Sungbacteria bacterium RIFCSPLOWO2_02_FULL_51_17]
MEGAIFFTKIIVNKSFMSEKRIIAQKKELAEVLGRLGLNGRDQEVYLALLRKGRATISPLARTTTMPVTTVQSVLQRLVSRGFVGFTKRRSRHVYEAYDPTVLRKIAQDQERDIASIIPFLLNMRGAVADAKIRIYWKERVTDIFNQALNAKSGKVYEIVSARDIQEVLGERFHFTKQRMQRNVRLRSLRIEKYEIKRYSRYTHVRELREAKFLPRELTFRTSLMFWDTTIAFFTAKDEGLAWTVESVSLSETFRQLFELLWSISHPMETLIEHPRP